MLELTGITKVFDGVIAVDGVDLSIPKGQTTVLIGPSGCGKSTLLRMMVGLVNPDHGQLTHQGTHISEDSLPGLRRNIGYVIQDGGLFPHLTARDNITIMADQLDWDDAQETSRLMDLCELAHFSPDMLDQYPLQLSGGQRQRVALMRALMLDPDLLLLDEPLGALDPLIRADLQGELRGIFQRLNKTVIMVTHDMHEAAFFGDTIVLLRQGKIVQSGSIDTLLNTPSDPFVTRFIKAQSHNLLDAGQ